MDFRVLRRPRGRDWRVWEYPAGPKWGAGEPQPLSCPGRLPGSSRSDHCGADLRQPRGSSGGAGASRECGGHQGGVWPDGDERHGDGGSHRRRSLHREVSRGLSCRGRALPSRAASQPLARPVWGREGRQHDNQRLRVPLHLPANRVGQRVLRQPQNPQLD